MHALLRAVPLALGSLSIVPALVAQSEERPGIFAPQAAPETKSQPGRQITVPRAPLSDRVRQTMTEQILASAKAVAAAPSGAPVPAAPATVTADGALLMARFFVKSVPPPASEVERRPPLVELGRFIPMERVDRRRNALSMPIMSFGDGRSLELNVVNGAGYGLDHNVDFTRVELGIRIRF
jgi:hypothetical protein